jgi:hypothetical protein
MTDAMNPKPIPVLGPSLPQQVHEALGKAIEAYALVEGEQVFLVQSIIGSDYPTATIIGFSMNANSRSKMIGELLEHAYKGGLDTYWPAPGSEDTELGVLMELEVGHGETEVYARVQG